ncbi:low-specificity L-threonine aldolase [candidate division KSB1 bacterium]|nr:low-specificity L-threonine aldolase [candidate division KSB1 bacterium]
MNNYIDLRSDTVTKPTDQMRLAIANADVGDDVFGDDPTVNLLQERVASMFGKDAALFVPSGTMANAVSILAHTRRGDEVIVEKESHTFNYEAAGPAVIGGVQLHPITGEKGILTASQIACAIRPPGDIHLPPTRLICLENTHNRGGGKIYPIEDIRAICETAKANQIKMHLDGARIFNSCVATGLKPRDYGRLFDSIMFCFSKGLGAPIGSIITGSSEFIGHAVRYRKLLGGGMRQVGILAAAALYALDHHIERLEIDHKHAKLLAGALAQINRFSIKPEDVETNIIIFDVTNSGRNAVQIVDILGAKGVLMVPFGEYLVRAVTHLNIDSEQIDAAIRTIQQCFA